MLKSFFKSRILFLAICVVVTVNCFSQEIYSNGNVRIVQDGGWKLYHGDIVVAYGDGVLDMDNLPPAFKAIIDNYAVAPVEKTAARAPRRNDLMGDTKYGPYITVNWNQGSPYNQCFPTVNGEPTLVGCSTIATAQVLNFFRHCDILDLKGRNQAYSDLKSPYFSDYEKNMDGTFYHYEYKYTPDFDKINADTAELSKFLFAVALAQHAYFDLDGTMTSIYTQRGALDNVFGYDYDLFTGNDIEAAVIGAVKKGWPVIMSGSNEVSGHSYNIDGYDGTSFHINYGWGGLYDGWYLISETLFPKDMTVVVTHPSDGTRLKMQAAPKSIRIYSTDEGSTYDKTFDMAPAWEDATEYIPKKLVDLNPGNYAFYFIYADGTTIAPYLEDNTPLSKLHESLISYGKYISSPAAFSVGYVCRVNFWHSPEMGYIQVMAQDFEDPDFKNLGVSLECNGQKTPMSYNAQNEEYSIVVDWVPGNYDFLFYVAKYDTTIGKAARCGEGPWPIYYGMEGNGMGWSSTYTDSPFNITLADYAMVAGKKKSVTKVKLKIVLDKYCDGRLTVVSYSNDPTNVDVITTEPEIVPRYNLLGQPANGNSRIIIINGKKYLQ